MSIRPDAQDGVPPPPETALAELRSERICAVIVTYQPDDESAHCIETIVRHAAHTVIVDNASRHECLTSLKALPAGRFTLVRNAENTGVAAGINRGIREARDRGFEWFVLFDQDTEIFPYSLGHLIEARRSCALPVGVQGASFFVRRGDGGIDDARVPFCGGQLWKEEDVVLTSGSLLHSADYDTIGPLQENYFIDYVDFEFCLRARERGLHVTRATMPVMLHRPGSIVPVRRWLRPGKYRNVSNYSPLRRYYSTRNLMLLRRDYGTRHPALFRQLFKQLRREIGVVIKYEGNKLAKLRAILAGYRDGRHGLAGKRPDHQ